MNVGWSIFTRGAERVAVPRVPLIIRLRSVVGDDFYEQPALRRLKSFLDANFVAGPALILIALYLPRGGGWLVVLGLLCLAVSSLYWFAPHWLCRLYLQRLGFAVGDVVEAAAFREALERAG